MRRILRLRWTSGNVDGVKCDGSGVGVEVPLADKKRLQGHDETLASIGRGYGPKSKSYSASKTGRVGGWCIFDADVP